ncbi:MAG: biotin--[acetyl-CoA-carboxylase] ligase [Mariprofundaceae bacterium]
MNSKREQIVAHLIGQHSPVSGDFLAAELGLSRAGIWKHIQILRDQDFDIEAIHGRGYLLKSDVLSASLLHQRLHTKRLGKTCITLDKIDSTNAEIMRQADKGADEGLVVFAEQQTQGKGRMGRSWHTLGEDALALSLLLRPNISPQYVSQLSLVTAVAIQKALSVFADDIRIKWPNDLLYHGAKIAGILTEMRAEPGLVHAVVTGIGINIRAPKQGWPDDITQAVTDLSTVAGKDICRMNVAQAIIEAMDETYDTYLAQGFDPIREQWWLAHAACNQPVRVHNGKEYIDGIAQDLDSDGALLLQTSHGLQRIITGDLELMA